VILQAAQKLGIENRVKVWGCSTPCNTDFLATALGQKWNHKLFVNAELTPPDVTNTPSIQLYRAILKQYGHAVSGGVGSFSQMGFAEAEIAVHALESIKLPDPHPQQRRLHGDAGERQDGHCAGVHTGLERRPAHRRLPQGGGRLIGLGA
jgi:hypothetical protein